MDYLSKLPTDSIYKMLAIGGLLLTVGCYYASESFQYFIAAKTHDLAEQISGDMIYTEDSLLTHAEAQTIIDTLASAGSAGGSDTINLAPDKRGEFLDSLHAGYGVLLKATQDPSYKDEKEVLHKAREAVRKEETRLTQLWYFVDLGNRIRFWSQIGSIVGIMLGTSGLVLWYFKVQRYQDQMLRQQASPSPARHKFNLRTISPGPKGSSKNNFQICCKSMPNKTIRNKLKHRSYFSVVPKRRRF